MVASTDIDNVSHDLYNIRSVDTSGRMVSYLFNAGQEAEDRAGLFDFTVSEIGPVEEELRMMLGRLPQQQGLSKLEPIQEYVHSSMASSIYNSHAVLAQESMMSKSLSPGGRMMRFGRPSTIISNRDIVSARQMPQGNMQPSLSTISSGQMLHSVNNRLVGGPPQSKITFADARQEVTQMSRLQPVSANYASRYNFAGELTPGQVIPSTASIYDIGPMTSTQVMQPSMQNMQPMQPQQPTYVNLQQGMPMSRVSFSR